MDTFAPSTKKPIKRQPQNFVEALKSIGGSTLKGISHDLIGGVGRDAVNSIFSPTSSSSENNSNQTYNPELPYGQERQWQESMERQQRHQEVLRATPIYDRHEEEIKAQIKALQDELKALAKDLTNASLSMQKAISEEIAHPGQYHISFFQKLRHFIINLRKQVNEANNWLEISQSRKQARNHYWGNVKKSGTKFMMSQERTVATSVG